MTLDRMSCDAIVESAMALMDGEVPPIDRAGIDRHVQTCARCRSEIESLGALTTRLAPVSRAAATADLWPAVDARLERRAAVRTGVVLSAASVCLLAWRAFEAATLDPLALWTRPVTIGIAVMVFLLLRVNPFRVDPRLAQGATHAES